MFFFCLIPLVSAFQATIIPYNFSNLSDRNAWSGFPTAANPFNATAPSAIANSTEYTNLATRDVLTANEWARGNGDFPFWRFNFTAKEANLALIRPQIQWLTVNVTGFDNATEVSTIQLYNFTSGAFATTIGTTPSSNGNVSMNYTENANATNFIQSSSGNITLYIEGPAYEAIDGFFIDFVQVDIMYLKDVDAPNWSSNMTNGTTNGTTINHSVKWTDDTTFSGYIFSFNNGNGTFLNDTWVAMTSDNWTNITKNVNTTAGSIINWSVYVNDSWGNLNVTGNFNYTTTAPPENCWSYIEATKTLYVPNGCTYYIPNGQIEYF